MSDNTGVVESKNTASTVKINGLSRNGGHQINGGGNKTCLTLNGYTPKSKGAPISGEFIQINGKMNGHMKSKVNGFSNGNMNGYDPEFTNGKVNGHSQIQSNGVDPGHYKSYNGQVNGYSKSYLNGHPSDYSNGFMNSSFEIESKNNKNVTFRIDNSLLRNSSGSSTDVPLNGKIDESNLKMKSEKGICTPKGKLKQGEITDEISTEL